MNQPPSYMAPNPKSPDGKWMLTSEGWVCLDSDLSKTPDGQWTFSNGRFVHANQLADEYIDGSIHLAKDVSSNESLKQELVSTRDSVIMGDLNVTVNQGPSTAEIKQMFVELLSQVGASTFQTPNNISESQRKLISERITSYDELISAGAASDPSTDLMVATAANVKGDYEDAKRRLEEILNAHPESPEANDAIQVLAQISIRRHDWDQAEQWVEKAMLRFEENGNWHGLGNTMMRRARILSNKGKNQLAIQMYQETVEIAKRKKMPRLHARSLANYGFLLDEIGRSSEAKDVLSQSLQLARVARDTASVSMINKKLSDIYEMEGDKRNAARLLRESRADLRETDDKFTQAERVLNEARILQKRNNLEMAKNQYKRAEGMFADIGANNKQGDICLTLAELYDAEQDLNSAISWYTKALGCFHEPPNPKDRMFCLSMLGDLYLVKKDFDESIKSSSLAIELAKQINDYEQQLMSLLTLCIAQLYNGNIAGGKNTLSNAKKLAAKHGLEDERFPKIDAMLANTQR